MASVFLVIAIITLFIDACDNKKQDSKDAG
jgi:hypothetical protein